MIALLLFVGVIFAGKWGIASAGHTLAMWHFESWKNGGNVPDIRTWKLVHESLRWSIRLDEDNASYYNDMGRLYEYSAIKMVEHESQAGPLLEIASAYFSDAIRLRPSWGLAWANLALIQHRRGIHDDAFFQDMLRAMQFGSSVPAVQLTMTELGISNWRELTVPMRRKVLAIIQLGLNGPWKRDFANIIQHYGMASYFCLILSHPQRTGLCKP